MQLKITRYIENILNKFFCNFGIKNILIFVFGLLSLLTISVVSWNTFRIIDKYTEAEYAEWSNATSQQALKLNNTIARERGFTATLLANKKNYKIRQKLHLKQFRKDTDKDLSTFRHQLSSFPDKDRSILFLKELNGISDLFSKNREEADYYLNNKNNIFNYQHWFNDITQRINALNNLHNSLLIPINEEDHFLQYGLLIKDILFTLSENSGRERALISTVLSQNRVFNESEYKLLDHYQNITNITIQRLNKFLNYFPKTAGIQTAKNNLNKIYLQDYHNLRTSVINKSKNGQIYPINSFTWFSQATIAINTIQQLSHAINQHFNQNVGILKNDVYNNLVKLALTIFVVVIVFFISFYITYYRIISPLKKLEHSANIIAEGDFTHSLPTMVNDEFGQVALAFEVMRDFLLKDSIRREKAEQQLVKLSTAIEQSISSIIITDINGITEYANPQFYATTGYHVDDVIGCKFNVIRSDKMPDSFYSDLWLTIKKGKVWQKEIINKKNNGELYWALVSISPVYNSDGAISHFISVQHDITEHKKLQERLDFVAYHDELTALPNRVSLAYQFELLTSKTINNEQKLALVLLDLDQFKLINDNLGHDVGDKILIEVGRRLKQRISGCKLVSRYGGDEFIVLSNLFTNTSSIFEVLNHIANIFDEPFEIAEHHLHITSSMGVSIWPEDGKEIDDLLRKADTAMYYAKDLGRGSYQFYTNRLNIQSSQRLRLENDLREAISNNEFELYYQPQIHIKTGQLIGVEALIRWNHKELGIISPQEFIPLAEETQLINPIGKWVLETACIQAKKWHDKGYIHLIVAINLSARQLDDGDFLDIVKQTIKTHKNPPECLEIEITESSVMNSPDKMHEILNEIKQLGVKLSMDDFGTGFSSLSYLRRFPFDKIKIDRSFITDITHNAEDAAIVKSIIELSHSLNKKVIAEGVETEGQKTLLNACHCDEIQGYLISKPIPSDLLEEKFLKPLSLTNNSF